MVDDAGRAFDPIVIKRTLETLGKIVTKPSLTEKLLRKPPFKFIHDIMTSVIRTTGFMQGIFTEDELNSENIKDRESKIAFLQKAIDYVSSVTGEQLRIRPGKTVAGHEPERTNEFLQALAKAIEQQTLENETVETEADGAAISKVEKASSRRNSKTTAKRTTKQDAIKERRTKGGESSKATSSHTKTAEKVKTNEGRTAEDKKRSSSNNRTRERASKREKESVRTKGARDNSKENRDSQRLKSRDRPTNRRGSKEKENDHEVVKSEERRLSRDLTPSTSKDTRNISTVKKKKKIEENGLKSPEKDKVREKKVENDEVVADEANASEEVAESLRYDGVLNGDVDNEMKSSQASNVVRSSSSSVVAGRPPTGRPPTTRPNGVDEGEILDSSLSISSPVELIGQQPEAQNGSAEVLKRPSTSTIRRSSARPPTARPAAPRVRVVDTAPEDVVTQQPMKQVSNIILDGDPTKDDEDETFVVDVPVAIANSEFTGELPSADTADGKPHGSLVTQILETKKDLESGSERTSAGGLHRVEIDSHLVSDSARLKEREMITREMDKLREGVQVLSKNANPLGKLVDYLQEDVDSMLRELDRWTLESKQHEQELERELSKGNVDMEDLGHQMTEVEEAIESQLAKICMVKANIIQNEEKIQRLVLSAKVL